MRVALYVRVSTGKQADKDLPIPSMIKELKTYAGRHGMEVLDDHIYIDGGRSGTSAKREAFQKMIEAAKIKPKPFEAILVWKFSRFARNREDSIIYKTLLKKKGVQVISINEPVDKSPAGKLFEGMIEVVDEFYSSNLGQDIRRGLTEVASRGFYTGGPILYGYKLQKALDGEVERTKLAIDEGRAGHVREIFRRYLAGEGAKSIVDDFNRRGIKPLKAEHWQSQVIYQILDNEKYAGTMTYRGPDGRVTRCENAHPAIIENQDFEKAKQLRQERRKSSPGTLGSRHLLSGLLRCGLCGGPVGAVKYRPGKTGYRCRNYHDKGKSVCSGFTIKASWIEDAVLEELKKRFLDPRNLASVLDSIKNGLDKALKSRQQVVNEIDGQIKDLVERRSRLYETLETGLMQPGEVAPRIREINTGLKELEGRLEAARRDQPEMIREAEIKKLASSLGKGLREGSVHQRRMLLSKVIDHVKVSHGNVEIVFKIPRDNGLFTLDSNETSLMTTSPGWAARAFSAPHKIRPAKTIGSVFLSNINPPVAWMIIQ